MRPGWTLRVVLAVVLAFGFCQVLRADNRDMERLMDEGHQAYNAANYPEALAKLQQGLEMAQRSGDRQAIVSFLCNLGLVYDHLGQYDQAREHLQHALVIKREIKDRFYPHFSALGWKLDWKY